MKESGAKPGSFFAFLPEAVAVTSYGMEIYELYYFRLLMLIVAFPLSEKGKMGKLSFWGLT